MGCSNGGVVLLDRSLHVLRTIAAFEGSVVAMQYLEVNDTVLTPASCRSIETLRSEAAWLPCLSHICSPGSKCGCLAPVYFPHLTLS